MKKYMMLVVLICSPFLVAADEEEQKFKNIAEVSSAFPGTGHVMIELGYRYRALYFAAKQNKWEFAEYQVEEIEELMERFEIISKKRKDSIKQFSKAVIGDLEKSLVSRQWKKFDKSFNAMRAQCVSCHVQNEMGFIELEIPTGHDSPALK